jgi:hypothetical protein
MTIFGMICKRLWLSMACCDWGIASCWVWKMMETFLDDDKLREIEEKIMNFGNWFFDNFEVNLCKIWEKFVKKMEPLWRTLVQVWNSELKLCLLKIVYSLILKNFQFDV